MFEFSDFQRLGMRVSIPDSDVDEYLQSQMRSIEALIAIMDNDNSLFEDLWVQAYFSTDRFEKERQEITNSPELFRVVDDVMRDPISCRYISELTCQKIDLYKNMSNKMVTIQQKYISEREKRKLSAPEQFYLQHEKELLNSIFELDTNTLNSIFAGTGVSMERLTSFIEARHVISEIDAKVERAQEKVLSIWNQYSPNYQLLRNIKVKGVV